jgi:hypothetical protein
MSYLGIPPFGRTARTVTELTATSGQTTFYPAGGYTVGYIDVVLNGVVLNNSDFTAVDGLAIVLGVGAIAGDNLKFMSYSVGFVELASTTIDGGFSNSTYLSSQLINGGTANG